MNENAALARPGRGLLVGYLLAFALPWLVWTTLIAEQHGLLGWHVPQSLAFWVGLPVAWLVAALASGGRAALLDLVSRLLRWRVGWRPYVLAIALAVVLPSAVWVGVLVAGGPALAADASPGAIPGALFVEIALFWLTEEAMWRGFVLPRVELRYAPGPASLVVGVLWALWHLPLFAIAGSFQSGLPVVGFALLTIATSVIIGWLFHRSSGSVLVCALYHGVVDVVFATTGVLSASATAFWAVVAVHVLAAGWLGWRAAWWRPGLRPLAEAR